MSIVFGEYGAQCLYRNYNTSYLGNVGNGKIVHRNGKLLMRSKIDVWSYATTNQGKHPSLVLTRRSSNDTEPLPGLYWAVVPWSEQTGEADNTTSDHYALTYGNTEGSGYVDLDLQFAQQLYGTTHAPFYVNGVEFGTTAVYTQGNARLFYPFWGTAPSYVPWGTSKVDSPFHEQTTPAIVGDEGRWVIQLPMRFTMPGSAENSTRLNWGSHDNVESWDMTAIFLSQRQHRIGSGGLTFTFNRWMSPVSEAYTYISEYAHALVDYVRSLEIKVVSY